MVVAQSSLPGAPSSSAAEDLHNANSSSSADNAASTTEGTPSNISIVDTSKEEGLEKANGPPTVQEFDYPDGGLRGRIVIGIFRRREYG